MLPAMVEMAVLFVILLQKQLVTTHSLAGSGIITQLIMWYVLQDALSQM